MLSDISNKDEVLNKLVLFFYQGFLNFVLKAEDIAKLSWDLQQNFIEATILNPLVLKYPLNKTFSRLYLKKLIGYLEPHQDVHDELYARLCTLMDDKTKDLFHYRHYIISHNLNNIISIKETNNLVVNGTTGMRTWEAGVIIADWALCNKVLFRNKKVLELGAGVGFTGITMSKFCEVKEYIFTDCHGEVLKALAHNVSVNFPYIHSEQINGRKFFESKECSMGIMPLDWNYIDDLPDLTPDIIIGADVVYDPSIIEPLCNVIQTFFNKNNNMKVYFAIIIRNEDTFKQFLLALDERCFKHAILQHKCNVHLTWDTNIERCLIKIHLYFSFLCDSVVTIFFV